MYSAYELTNASRNELLNKFPPVYPEVICHHITVEFPSSELPPAVHSAHVVGYEDSGDGLEAFVVEINGSSKRPDGKLFHITISLDRSKGKKPVHSNDLVAKGYRKFSPIAIHLTPKILS